MNATLTDWRVLLGIVVVLLFAVDPPVATLRPHAVAFREAAAWSVFFVAVAAEFGLILASLLRIGYGPGDRQLSRGNTSQELRCQAAAGETADRVHRGGA